jgi:hypothetical protein
VAKSYQIKAVNLLRKSRCSRSRDNADVLPCFDGSELSGISGQLIDSFGGRLHGGMTGRLAGERSPAVHPLFDVKLLEK